MSSPEPDARLPSEAARDAVSELLGSEDFDCPWIPMDDEILLMLRAAYAVDLAPLQAENARLLARLKELEHESP